MLLELGEHTLGGHTAHPEVQQPADVVHQPSDRRCDGELRAISTAPLALQGKPAVSHQPRAAKTRRSSGVCQSALLW